MLGLRCLYEIFVPDFVGRPMPLTGSTSTHTSSGAAAGKKRNKQCLTKNLITSVLVLLCVILCCATDFSVENPFETAFATVAFSFRPDHLCLCQLTEVDRADTSRSPGLILRLLFQATQLVHRVPRAHACPYQDAKRRGSRCSPASSPCPKTLMQGQILA